MLHSLMAAASNKHRCNHDEVTVTSIILIMSVSPKDLHALPNPALSTDKQVSSCA